MTSLLRIVLACVFLASAALAQAQGNLDIDTPAIAALKSSMHSRHAQLAPYYASGAIGLAGDGSVAIRDAKVVALAQRGALSSLVAAENADRARLYQEIAQANGHPEWTAQVRSTFAQRWIDKAPSGWWVQRGGGWAQK